MIIKDTDVSYIPNIPVGDKNVGIVLVLPSYKTGEKPLFEVFPDYGVEIKDLQVGERFLVFNAESEESQTTIVADLATMEVHTTEYKLEQDKPAPKKK